MASGSENQGPTYIAPHSADAILSDFRPIKLQHEALCALNTFIDELLAKVLTAAQSLLTDHIKTGLLRILPTTLGKEALLEAELELRAYWERISAFKPSASQAAAAEQNVNLAWAIELMRLKCEAYSTLNDSDEDAQAEARLAERMGQTPGASPPKAVLVAPAALYLTAILECICEHILTNVGRVVTRDSSRATAGMQDLFVALCEDDAVYPCFKTMKVYEQIESSIKAPRPRRSKSISRAGERQNAGSPLPGDKDLAWSRLSSESSTSGVALLATVSRPSMEKAKAIKLFKAHNRSSSDREASPVEAVPRKPESFDGVRKSISDGLGDGVSFDVEDDELDQEFDDLMLSGETMKVSLTPDRLRTMEPSKRPPRPPRKPPQKVASADNTRPGATPNDPQVAFAATDPRHHGARRPSVHHVDSIIEDEEPRELISANDPPQPNNQRPRPDMPLTPPSPVNLRIRSTSTSSGLQSGSRHVTHKSSLGVSTPPVSLPPQMRDTRIAPNQNSAMPQRTRKIQRNRESLDLDEIMNGSDGESDAPASVIMSSPSRQAPYAVSNSARDLINFLEEGPPPDIHAQHSAMFSTVSLTPTTKSGKGGSRLQRMMSKLSLSGSDRNDKGYSPDRRPQQRNASPYYGSAPSTPSGTSRSDSYTVPLPVPVKPVPPRILPAPISPPSSPSRASSYNDEQAPVTSSRAERERARTMSVSRKAVPSWNDQPLPTPPSRDQQQRLTPLPHPSPSPVPRSSPVPSHSPQPAQSSVRGGSGYPSPSSEHPHGPRQLPSPGYSNATPGYSSPSLALAPSPVQRQNPNPASSPTPGHASTSPIPPPSPRHTNGAQSNGQDRGPGSVRGLERMERNTESPRPMSRPEGSGSPPPTGDGAFKENGRGDFTPKPVYRPRSSRSNNRPTSAESNGTSGGRRTSAKRPLAMVGQSQAPPAGPVLSEDAALDMRKLMTRATTADECRLLVDMFLAKAGIALPSPVSTEERHDGSPAIPSSPGTLSLRSRPLEHSLIELFLGEDASSFAYHDDIGAHADGDTKPDAKLAEARLPYTHSDEHIAKGLPTPPVDTHVSLASPLTTTPARADGEHEHLPQQVSAAA